MDVLKGFEAERARCFRVDMGEHQNEACLFWMLKKVRREEPTLKSSEKKGKENRERELFWLTRTQMDI